MPSRTGQPDALGFSLPTGGATPYAAQIGRLALASRFRRDAGAILPGAQSYPPVVANSGDIIAQYPGQWGWTFYANGGMLIEGFVMLHDPPLSRLGDQAGTAGGDWANNEIINGVPAKYLTASQRIATICDPAQFAGAFPADVCHAALGLATGFERRYCMVNAAAIVWPGTVSLGDPWDVPMTHLQADATASMSPTFTPKDLLPTTYNNFGHFGKQVWQAFTYLDSSRTGVITDYGSATQSQHNVQLIFGHPTSGDCDGRLSVYADSGQLSPLDQPTQLAAMANPAGVLKCQWNYKHHPHSGVNISWIVAYLSIHIGPQMDSARTDGGDGSTS
jgi:hypothetical protein